MFLVGLYHSLTVVWVAHSACYLLLAYAFLFVAGLVTVVFDNLLCALILVLLY